jgi:hypothetical protein
VTREGWEGERERERERKQRKKEMIKYEEKF